MEALKELDEGTYSGASDAYKLDIQCVNFTMTDEELKKLKGYFYCYFPSDTVFEDLWLQGQLNVTLTGTTERSFDILTGGTYGLSNSLINVRSNGSDSEVSLNNTQYTDEELLEQFGNIFMFQQGGAIKKSNN